MKAFTMLGTAVLFMSLGSTVPAFAQHEQEETKPEQKQQQEHAQPQQQHAQPQQQAKQAEHQSQEKQQASQPQQHAEQRKQLAAQAEQHAQQQNQQKQQAQQQSQKNQQHQQQAAQAQDQNQNNRQPAQEAQQHNYNRQPGQHTQEQQRVQQAAWQDRRSQNWQSDHRSWQQRGGYHGYRIPDDRYNGYFGPNYGFVIYNQPFMVVGGFPRFQYGGYWFSVVDPWPNTWANNWYQTDDVYVVYQNDGYYLYNQRYPGIGIAITVSM